MGRSDSNTRLAEWMSAVGKLATRAEELKDATQAFADTVFLETLKTRQNQVISGRRGTGKTHLLKRLRDEFLKNFDSDRSVPIVVNGTALRNQATSVSASPALVALSLYVEFIKTVSRELHNFINDQVRPSTWEKLFGGDNTQKAKNARRLVAEIHSIITTGEVKFLPAGDASSEFESLQETSAKVSGGVSLSLSDPRKIGWKVDLGASGTAEEKTKGLKFRKLKGQVILPFSEVSRRIEELLSVLDRASLVVLFDEWSDLAEDLETQPYFADMIKRTLSSIRNMYVKLACIPTRTRLATSRTKEHPIPLGYELGDDISVDVDLDSVVFVENDLSQFLPFFVLVLQRHMGIALPWVSEMEARDFEEFLISDVFGDYSVFSEICQASAGVTRDFLNLFRKATLIQGQGTSRFVQLSHIRRAAKEVHDGKKADSFSRESRDLRILEKIYRDVVAEHKSYFFLLPENHNLAEIEHLWSERLVHKLRANFYDTKTHTLYNYFQMDYGMCVDFLSADAEEAGKKKGTVWAKTLYDFKPESWFGALAAKHLPTLGAYLEKKKAIERTQAGKLNVDPVKVIVDVAVLESLK